MRYRLRTLLIVLAIGPPAIALGVAVFVEGMPFTERSEACIECGKQRSTHETWGRITKDQITDNQVSQWAAPMVPEGHVHVWTTSSFTEQREWFGGVCIACGGDPEGAFAAWQLANLGQQAAAEQAYLEFQDILNGKSSKTIGVHRKEMLNAISAAATLKRQQ